MKYSDSGVDIDAAQAALRAARAGIRATWDRRVRSDLGSFGGLFQPRPEGPLLVASVDGVGTKVMVARLAGRLDSVGEDLVNHCVDDILVQGAEPLFFLDYFAASRLQPGMLEQVLEGFVRGCRANGCALLGGETAEMPGVYAAGEFDLAGCIVGEVAPEHLIDGRAIRPGDRIWGLPSSGLHTNGYSLARRILFEKAGWTVDTWRDELGSTVGDALLAVHRSYLEPVRTLWHALGRDALHGLVHITGGGFYDNVPRVVPDGCCARIETAAWEPPPLFRLLAELGDVPPAEMYRVFNMGIGMLLFTPAGVDPAVMARVDAVPVGEVVAGEEPVAVVLSP